MSQRDANPASAAQSVESQTLSYEDYRLDVLAPGSIVIERYVYIRESGKPGVQWIVHKVRPDREFDQLFAADTRREALAYVR